jgi:hypothetical protein
VLALEPRHPTPTTCARCCSPTPSATRRRSPPARRPRTRARRRASCSGGAPGCSTARDGAARPSPR